MPKKLFQRTCEILSLSEKFYNVQTGDQSTAQKCVDDITTTTALHNYTMPLHSAFALCHYTVEVT